MAAVDEAAFSANLFDFVVVAAAFLPASGGFATVGRLLRLLLYVYGIAGFCMFREVDPTHWGSLGAALLSLFQVVTLEGWADMQQALLPQRPWAWVFFASLIVVAVFVVINRFIAVVINNLEEAKEQEHRAADASTPEHDLLARVAALKREVEGLETALRSKASHRSSPYQSSGPRCSRDFNATQGGQDSSLW